MSEAQRANLFAATPWWLWPVLWWSLARHEAWLARYWAEHGPCPVMASVTAFGTVRILYIGAPVKPEDGRPRLSRPSFLALARALTPQLVISQPVRTASCAFARRAAAAHGLASQGAPRLRPVSLAPI